MRINYKYLSPFNLLILIWTITFIGAFISPHVMLERTNRSYVFTTSGTLWIILCFVAFYLGTVSIQMIPNVPTNVLKGKLKGRTFTANRILFFFNIFSFLVIVLTIFWLKKIVNHVGGINLFIYNLTNNWDTTKDLWSDLKFFPGARLLLTSLISINIIGFSVIALKKNNQIKVNPRVYRISNSLSLCAISFLFLLPLIVSGRLLFGVTLFGSIITYTAIRGKGIPVRTILITLIIAFTLWTLQETLIRDFSFNGFMDALSFSFEKLGFYFSNNLANVMYGVAYTHTHTYGLLSFDFIFKYFLGGGSLANSMMSDTIARLQEYKGGGTWTGLGTLYIDFGPIGAIFVYFWGLLSEYVFRLSFVSIKYKILYSLIAASILFSFQTQVWSQPFFWFNFILIIIFANRLKNCKR